MTRVTHELCITRIGFTHDPYSWGIQLTHDPLKRKIYIKKKITRARHGAPLRGSPTPYGRGSPSRISWPPAGAAMCPPTAYGLRGFALRLPPPPPFRGERVALCRQGCRAYGPAALLSFTPAGSVAATVQRQGFALRAEILTRSVLRASPLRSAAASGFALDPAPTLNSRTAGQPNSRQQAKTARSGVFWPWWYIRQGWGKKTRCRPVSGLSGGICRFHSKWTPVPVFRGQLTTPLGHLATSATGHKRSLAHCEHLSVLAHEKKKPSRAPDVALCLMQGHTLNITFVML